MSLEGIVKGGIIAGTAYFIDGLEPVPFPEECGENKVLAVAQYAMIGCFAIATVTAIALTILGNVVAAAVAAIAVPITVLGSYGLKDAVLNATIEEQTAALNEVNDQLTEQVQAYEQQVTRLAGQVNLLTGQVGELNRTNREREQLIENQRRERLQLEAQIGEMGRVNEEFRRQKDQIKEIPKQLKGLADQIEGYVSGVQGVSVGLKKSAKDLNLSLQKSIEENSHLENYVELLEKVIGQFTPFVSLMLDLHKESQSTIDEMRGEVDRLDEILKQLTDESDEGVEGDELIKKHERQTEKIKANKDKLAELQKRWDAIKNKDQGGS